MPVAPMYHDG
jgi:hypothetical protein